MHSSILTPGLSSCAGCNLLWTGNESKPLCAEMVEPAIGPATKIVESYGASYAGNKPGLLQAFVGFMGADGSTEKQVAIAADGSEGNGESLWFRTSSNEGTRALRIHFRPPEWGKAWNEGVRGAPGRAQRHLGEEPRRGADLLGFTLLISQLGFRCGES